ncbi:redoxin domain-containing protein [Heyndrickxia acidiproducens]|uniref:redoxin domain-containing protein n=1 Tax=Heyndrickxia acidiproducens TaxID=1121084 RepID=UPI00146C2344|nr:redoxin domain-containing protein [Heyndrickxia acidiproducens]
MKKLNLAGIFLIVLLLSLAVVQAVRVHQTKEATAAAKEQDSLEKLYEHTLQSETEEPPPTLVKGTAAPGFSLQGLNQKTIRLSDFKGKKVLLNFWATWCPPCKKEMPMLEQFYKKHQSEFTVIAVNLDTGADVKRFAKNYGLTFPVLLDKNQETSHAYNVMALPTTYLLDENGKILDIQIGQLTDRQLKKWRNTGQK